MSKTKVLDRDYLFISAMVRARETKMLNAEAMERMLAASSFDEAAKLLTDLGYADLSGGGFAEIEQELAAHRETIFTELGRLAPQPELVDIFRLPYDYHNAKVLIKAEAADVDGARLLSGAGSVAVETLREGFLNGDYRGVPTLLAKAMREAKDALARSGNAQTADFLLDRAYFAHLAEKAAALESDFLSGYCALLADCANLKACVRSIRLHKDAEFLKHVLVPCGTVSESRISAGLLAGEALSALFSSTKLREAAAAGDSILESGDMTAFEKLCDTAVTSYLGDAGFVSFGMSPLIAYICAVENEITAVRVILTGKKSGIPAELLRERLRDRNV